MAGHGLSEGDRMVLRRALEIVDSAAAGPVSGDSTHVGTSRDTPARRSGGGSGGQCPTGGSSVAGISEY